MRRRSANAGRWRASRNCSLNVNGSPISPTISSASPVCATCRWSRAPWARSSRKWSISSSRPRAAGIDIHTYLPADLPAVRLHKEMFQQALLNLMLNAEQALAGGGGSITVQAALETEHVCLSLIDTGQGMAPDVLAKVFEPFYSTKSDGSGLGLPTTRKIIEAHRGSIDVQSEVGKGTKFTVRLPIVCV